MSVISHDFSVSNAQAIHYGESLLKDLSHSLKTAQQTKQVTKLRYSDWKAKAQPKPKQDAAMAMPFETAMFGAFFQALFGLIGPGLMLGPDMAQGLGMLAAGARQDQADQAPSPLTHAHKINDHLISLGRARYQEGVQHQAAQIAELMAMMKSVMETLNKLKEEKDSLSSEALIPDALRHPKMARFKQGRKEIYDIERDFANHVRTITPKFPALRRA